MTGFARFRGPAQPVPGPPPAVPPPGPLHPAIAAKLQKLRNEKAALECQLRDMARERIQLKAQVEAAAKIIAGAKRECAERCVHAVSDAARQVQLVKMQAVQDQLQAANAAYRGGDLKPAPVAVVPKQRGRTR